MESLESMIYLESLESRENPGKHRKLGKSGLAATPGNLREGKSGKLGNHDLALLAARPGNSRPDLETMESVLSTS